MKDRAEAAKVDSTLPPCPFSDALLRNDEIDLSLHFFGMTKDSIPVPLLLPFFRVSDIPDFYQTRN